MNRTTLKPLTLILVVGLLASTQVSCGSGYNGVDLDEYDRIIRENRALRKRLEDDITESDTQADYYWYDMSEDATPLESEPELTAEDELKQEPEAKPETVAPSETRWQNAYERVYNGDNVVGRVYCNGQYEGEYEEENEYYSGFCLFDFDGDGIPELIITLGGWEWYDYEIYSYKDENIHYSRVAPFMALEESSNFYISEFSYIDDTIYAYQFKQGEFNVVDDYADVIVFGHYNATNNYDFYGLRIGNAIYPLSDFEDVYDWSSNTYTSKWEKPGFKRIDIEFSPNYKTALVVYLQGTD